MYDSSGVRRYQETDCNTMSPEKMIVLLYEAIVRHENQAREAALAGNKLDMNKSINMAQRIISELRGALDHSIGGEIAANLDALYAYMFRENLEAIVDQDPAHFENVLSSVAPLLEAWRQIPPGTKETAQRELIENNQNADTAEEGPDLAEAPVDHHTPSGLEAERPAESLPSQTVAPVSKEAQRAYSLSISA